MKPLLVSLGLSAVAAAGATPQFARQTGLPCTSCHVHGSLLNDFGQRYFANGFRIGKKKPKTDTPPLWATLGAQVLTDGRRSAAPISYAQTEITSYGYLDNARLLYHLAYQPTKEQTDIYLLSPLTPTLTVQAGEIGLLGQYIPKLDLSPSRPVYLQPTGGPFAPGANAFAVRLVGSLDGTSAMPYADGWKVAATVPFSNETGSAWQPEFDETPTGLFAEVFRRQGFTSYGLNTFTGRDGRHYYGAIGQRRLGDLYLEGGAAYATSDESRDRLASLALTYVPEYHKAFGFRVDSQDGALAFVPTLGYMIGDQMSVLRLTAETRISRGSGPTAVFSAQFKF